MIREILAAMGGLLSGLAVFFIVLLYQVESNPSATLTGISTPQQIAGPIFGQANQRANFLGVPGIYSGVFSALVLVFLAVGAGILVSKVGRTKLKGEGIS